MSRFAFPLALAMFAALLAPAIQAQEPKRAAGLAADSLQLGKPLTGRIDGTKTLFSFNGGSDHFYQARVPVTLQAGQSIAISASVTGQSRRIVLSLLDPNSASLGVTKNDVKTTTFKVDEVNDTGNYTILVLSDLTGPFTIRAVGDVDTANPAASAPSLAGLEQRVKQLELELRDIREELDELKAKSKR